MGQKAITIYTPDGTAAHIAAEDDAFIHRSVLGSASGILGSLSCGRVDDNTVRLSGGGVSNRGYILYVPVGETAELSIDSGTAGYNRARHRHACRAGTHFFKPYVSRECQPAGAFLCPDYRNGDHFHQSRRCDAACRRLRLSRNLRPAGAADFTRNGRSVAVVI